MNEGFPQVPLSNLADLRMGGTPSRAEPSYWAEAQSGHPWVSIADLNGKFIDTTRETITDSGVNAGRLRSVPPGVPIMSFKLTIGKCAIPKRRVFTNEAIIALAPLEGRSVARWLYHVVPSIASRQISATAVKGQTLNLPKLRRLLVPVPAIGEQRQIAEILDAIDEQIDAESKILGKLASAGGAVLFRELRQINKFHSVRLEEIAVVERGRFVARPRNDPRFYGGAYPFIQTGDVTRGSGKVIHDATQSLNEDGRRMSREFPAGTIAVTIAANIGETSILGRPMCFPDSVVGVVASPGVSTRFLELCIRRQKPILEARAPQSAQKNINLQDLRPLEIPLPPRDVQMFIERLWSDDERLIGKVSQGMRKLEMFKKGLMEDLLTGRVRLTRAGELTG